VTPTAGSRLGAYKSSLRLAMRMDICIRLLLVFVSGASMSAQWIHHTDPKTPRMADGTPNLTAPLTRTADGKPDLSGIWMRVPPLKRDNPANNNLLDYMPAGATISMRPEAAAMYQHRRDVLGTGRPSERCLPHGIPDAMLPGVPYKIVETPGIVLILYEQLGRFRQVFTDGRAYPADAQPAWWGYSIGKWDGDAFLIETTGYNDKTWLDDSGHPHSDAMKTTERFRRLDFGHMELQVTIDDPKFYMQPFTATIPFEILPDTELIEDVCDNEKDAARISDIVGK
jgi:hypothetical protein